MHARNRGRIYNYDIFDISPNGHENSGTISTTLAGC